MKTEHYKNLEKKFFVGETTQEEEKFLKDQDNEGLFHILKEEKQETMEWNFEDFLNKTQEKPKETPIIPLTSIGKKKNNFRSYSWIAASLVLMFGTYITWNQLNNDDIKTADERIAQEINRQQDLFNEENNIVSNKEDEDDKQPIEEQKPTNKTEENIADIDVLEEILPKKGRIQKKSKPKYTSINQNHQETTTIPEYQPNYVIINGQKITDENEAIEVTKYSMQLLSNKVSKTIANTVTLDNSSDY